VLAAGPVLLALPRGRRLAGALAAGVVAAAIEAPLLLAAGSGYVSSAGAVASASSAIFQPWQLFWFFGHHGALVHGLFGAAKPGYRIAPAWTGQVSHPLVLVTGFALAGALWLRTRGRSLDLGAALLALSVVLLARCLLDTWDTAYYLLGAIFALTAWESLAAVRRPPVVALAVTVAASAEFRWLPGRTSPDAQSAVFLAWTLPLVAWLAAHLLAATRLAPAGEAPREQPVARPRRAARPAAQPTTVSSFESPVSTSGPPSRTTTRSSMRTPSAPGR
jgi:hypothetical protein